MYTYNNRIINRSYKVYNNKTIYIDYNTSIIRITLCTYHCYAPPTPGRARVGIIGDLQESFDKFPTPGDNFMLQIPYILYRDFKNNETSWTNAPTLPI